MNKPVVIGTVGAVVGLFALGGEASATVGGPLLLSELKYDDVENKAYYLQASLDGAGFGPSLIEYDPMSQTFSTIAVDPYLLERLDDEEREDIRFTDFAEVEEFLADLDSLPRIDLARNDIDFDISLAEDYDAEYANFWPEYLQVELVVQVLQEGKAIGNTRFYDCGDRVAFEGFLIPGTNQLLLFINNVGVCTETGYTVDRIVPITGFTANDSTVLTGSIPVWEEREWPAGMIPQREGTVVATVEAMTEEKYARLENFAKDAHKDGELKSAAEYLATIWGHCCSYREVDEDKKAEYYAIAFELAAIQSERGEIRGYKAALPTLEDLFERVEVDSWELYRQQVITDVRFEQLRSELSEDELNGLLGISREAEFPLPPEEPEEPEKPQQPADLVAPAVPPGRADESRFPYFALFLLVLGGGSVVGFMLWRRMRKKPAVENSNEHPEL